MSFQRTRDQKTLRTNYGQFCFAIYGVSDAKAGAIFWKRSS